ncbi:hypothetical protein MTR67_051836 [Solanum verrucosum]|uniref:Tf2-1-like SH3-like domain-containing protein n=1 Tax=Solanum verrucosum TaxID=315347 RepID=A0AAF0V897_SOLVR|nr:hypothetical protein MTR67_051836 [Solanum verrucosum]
MVDELQNKIMEEAHSSRYSIYPSSIKMYRDLRHVYWWSSIKWCNADFFQVPKLPTRQDSSFQPHRLGMYSYVYRGAQFTIQLWKSFKKGLGSKVNLSTDFHPQIDGQGEHTIKTLEDMLRACMIDFKEFEVDDWVYLKVSPMKGVMRFGKWGKLTPRYIGPYRISKRVSSVAYELELASELAEVHPMFHLSMLKKCMCDPSFIISTKNIGIKDKPSYKKIPVQILDRQVRKLRTKEVASVKVLWKNKIVDEATWEAKEDMKKRYPYLFPSREIPNQGTNPL